MQNFKFLSVEDVKQIGSFCFDNQTMLDEFMEYQNQDDELFDYPTSPIMGSFLLAFEPRLYQFASYLSPQYKGGTWSMEYGFFLINDDKTFHVQNNYVESDLNAMEFSIVCNLFALSSLAMSTYNDKKPDINHLSVFFSDYIKQLMEFNNEQLNTSIIWRFID